MSGAVPAGRFDHAAGGSILFDRAAEFYDETRSLAPETIEAIVQMLAAEVEGRGRCLEIGVGTGRISLPLAEAGIRMAGIDLSVPMLRKLLEKSPEFPVAVADASLLPFGDGSFGGAIACHVLHLIADWRGAVAELVRVVRPGGVVLVDIGGRHDFLREIEEYFTTSAGIGRARLGVTETADLDEEMAGLRTSLRELPMIQLRRPVAPASYITALEANVFSVTWSLDEETRRGAAAVTREWASGRFGELSEPIQAAIDIAWRAYDIPGG